MNDLLSLLILALIAAGIVALGWWLLIETEGVYLGRRVVIWLYDVYAGRYDDIKHFRREYDHMYLAQPILKRIEPNTAPLILDVATGTGRLPLAMIRHTHFRGHVIGADLSRRMLDQASRKFTSEHPVSLIVAPAEYLPFADDTFDVVTCLEALEFMVNPRSVLAELVRVLKPNGLLLITNRISTKLMPGKTFATEDLVRILFMLNIDEISVEKWQVDYDQVWGLKLPPDSPAP